MAKKAAEKEVKKIEDFKQTKPYQMALFEMILPEDKNYSCAECQLIFWQKPLKMFIYPVKNCLYNKNALKLLCAM